MQNSKLVHLTWQANLESTLWICPWTDMKVMKMMNDNVSCVLGNPFENTDVMLCIYIKR